MKREIIDIINASTAAVLATTGPHGLNVVPVSVWEVVNGEIHLYDFFMCKTAENIQAQPGAVFTCWEGFAGVQVKAEATYEQSGQIFTAAKQQMKEAFPDRSLRAVIRLVPNKIYSVTPGSIVGDLI